MKLRLKFSNGLQTATITVDDNVSVGHLYGIIADQFRIPREELYLSLDKTHDFARGGADGEQSIKTMGVISGDTIFVSNRPFLLLEENYNVSQTPASTSVSVVKSSTGSSANKGQSNITAQPSTSSANYQKTNSPSSTTSPKDNRLTFPVNLKLLRNKVDALRLNSPAEIMTATVHYIFMQYGFSEMVGITDLPKNWQQQLNDALLHLCYRHPQAGVSLNVSVQVLSNRVLNSKSANTKDNVGVQLIAVCMVGDDVRKVDFYSKLQDFAYDDKQNFEQFVRLVDKMFVSRAASNVVGYNIESPLLNLPIEILIRIARKLPFNTFKWFCSSCSRLHGALWDNESLWKHYLRRDFDDTNEHPSYKNRYAQLYISHKLRADALRPYEQPQLIPPIRPRTPPRFPEPEYPPRFPDPQNPPRFPDLQPPRGPGGIIGGPEDGRPPEFYLPQRYPQLQPRQPRIFPRHPATRPPPKRDGPGGSNFFGFNGFL